MNATSILQTVRRAALAAGVFVSYGACTAPEYSDCSIRCGPGGSCPLGMSCSNGLCTHGNECRDALADGGAPSATGGASSTTGGASSTTGGASSTTGGASSTTGGASSTTGGASSTTGGERSATGGTHPDSGGGSSTGGGNTGGGTATDAGGDSGSGGGGAGPVDRCATPPRCSASLTFEDAPVSRTFPNLSSFAQGALQFSSDERMAVFAAGPLDEPLHFYHVTYDRQTNVFGEPSPLLDESGVAFTGADPALSPDGLSLYFTHLGSPNAIWVATRDTVNAPFKAGVELSIPGVNTSQGEGDPFVSCDGATLYFDSGRDGLQQLYSVSLTGSAPPARVLAEAPTYSDIGLALSDDELTLYFGSEREGPTKSDIFMARRNTKQASFGRPVQIYNSNGVDYPDAISKDGCTLWFNSAPDTRSKGALYTLARRQH
jgi:hypothetical protein